MSHENLPIFVYGTLKRGQIRAGRWPRAPQSVVAATTRGRLYDLGPYPALIAGTDVVLGELWYVAPDDLDETLRVLDEIECYGHEDVDLYVRLIVDCVTDSGVPQRAYTYYFADPTELAHVPLVEPNVRGVCEWTRL